MDLPGEIQNRIYEFAYATPYIVTVSQHGPAQTLTIVRDGFCNLHGACKQTYVDSQFAQDLGATVVRCNRGPIAPFDGDAAMAEFRSFVTKIEYFGFTPANMNYVTFTMYEWDGLRSAYPNVNEIHIDWTTTGHHFEKGSKKQTEEWKSLWRPGAHRAFLNGEERRIKYGPEIDYERPLDRLKLQRLYHEMNSSSDRCKIFVTGIRQYLDHRRKPVYAQKIKAELRYTGRKGLDLVVVGRWAHKM